MKNTARVILIGIITLSVIPQAPNLQAQEPTEGDLVLDALGPIRTADGVAIPRVAADVLVIGDLQKAGQLQGCQTAQFNDDERVTNYTPGQIILIPFSSVVGLSIDFTNSFLLCPESARAEIFEGYAQGAGVRLDAVGRTFAKLMGWLINLFVQLGAFLINIVGSFVGALLGAGQFITNELVRIGWPFVQGIANLGFIIALLAIAALTTLRIDIGGGVRRLLPRLLIAALFINFSLVIGGVLIDLSRVLMVIITSVVGAGTIQNIGAGMLRSSDLINTIYQVSTQGEWTSLDYHLTVENWSHVMSVFQSAIFVWSLLGALVVIGVGLFMRYVMLILLLIVSPLAYLAIAMPGFSQLGMQWWTYFLRYVIYGPVALFILVLVVATNRGLASVDFPANTPGIDLLQSALQVAITIAFTIAAATFGKRLGIVGAGAAVGFVGGQYKRAGRAAYRGAAGTTKAGAKFVAQRPTLLGGAIGGALGGPAGAALGAAIGRIGGVQTRKAIKNSQDFLDERKKAQQKKEEKRSKESYGRKAAQAFYASPETKAAKTDAQKVSKEYASLPAGTRISSLATNPSLSPTNLVNPNFTANLAPEVFKDLVEHGTADQQSAIINVSALAGSLDEGKRKILINNAKGDPSRGIPARPDLVGKIVNNINIVKEMKDQEKADIMSIGNPGVTKDLLQTMQRIQRQDK